MNNGNINPVKHLSAWVARHWSSCSFELLFLSEDSQIKVSKILIEQQQNKVTGGSSLTAKPIKDGIGRQRGCFTAILIPQIPVLGLLHSVWKGSGELRDCFRQCEGQASNQQGGGPKDELWYSGALVV